MGLLKTQAQIAKLESEILSQFGEVSEEQYNQLDALNNQIEKARVDSFRFLHAKRPAQIIENIDQRVKDLKAEKERIKKIDELMQLRLHQFFEDNGLPYISIDDEQGNPEFYAKPDMSVQKSIDSKELSPEEIKYQITLKTSNINDIEKVRSFIINNTNVFSITADQIIPKISDLPENHPAVKKHLTPKIKFVKNKPKEIL